MSLLQFPKQRWPLPRKARDLLLHGPGDPETLLRVARSLANQGWSRTQIAKALLDPRHRAGKLVQDCADPRALLRRLFESIDWSYRPHLPKMERQRRIRVVLRANGPMSQKAIIAAVGHANDGDVRKDLVEMAAAGILQKTPVPHGKVTWYTVQLLVSDHEAEEREREIRLRAARAIGRRKAREQAGVLKAFGQGGGVSSDASDGLDLALRRLTSVRADAVTPPSLAEMLADGLDAAGRTWLAERQRLLPGRQVAATGPLTNRELLDSFDASACPCGSHGANAGPSCTAGAGCDESDLSLGLAWLEEDDDPGSVSGEEVQVPDCEPWSDDEVQAANEDFCAWCEANL